MRIQTNIHSLKSQTALSRSMGSLAQSVERLGSGLRINSAKDDAAGQGISNRMTAQIRGKDAANRQIADAASMLQVADGALDSINDQLQRMRELLVQKETGTLSQSDRDAIQTEIDQIVQGIDDIAKSTQYNGHYLLRDNAPLTLQIGANTVSGQDTISFEMERMDHVGLGLYESTIPLSDPITEGYAGRADLGNYGYYQFEIDGTLIDGVSHTRLEIADRFGVSPDEITLHHVFHPDTGSQHHRMALKVGNQFLYTNLYQMPLDSSTGIGHPRITMTPISYTDPDNGIVAPTVSSDSYFYQIGIGPDGTLTPYYEFQGKTFLADTVNAGAVVLSGPGANDVEMKPFTKWNELADAAIQRLSDFRSRIGATMNRLESIATLNAQDGIDLQAARSRIEDADYARESSGLAKSQILQNASQSILVQANQIPAGIAQLLDMSR